MAETKQKKAIAVCLREREARQIGNGFIGIYPCSREMQQLLVAFLKLNKAIKQITGNLLWKRNGDDIGKIKLVLERVTKVVDEMNEIVKEIEKGGK